MGPAVWLDMDQTQLDDAYNQRIYAPNIDQLREQSAFNNQLARERLGPPLKFAYGSGPTETLDVYRTGNDGGPVNVFIHGGTWRYGVANEFTYLAEPLINNGLIRTRNGSGLTQSVSMSQGIPRVGILRLPCSPQTGKAPMDCHRT